MESPRAQVPLFNPPPASSRSNQQLPPPSQSLFPSALLAWMHLNGQSPFFPSFPPFKRSLLSPFLPDLTISSRVLPLLVLLPFLEKSESSFKSFNLRLSRDVLNPCFLRLQLWRAPKTADSSDKRGRPQETDQALSPLR